jgi:hypothetical protein
MNQAFRAPGFREHVFDYLLIRKDFFDLPLQAMRKSDPTMTSQISPPQDHPMLAKPSLEETSS